MNRANHCIAIAPGVTLQDRYRVVDRLGSGSQATVWHCLDTVHDTPVAIKHASDPAEWPNARREYVLLRLLRLPGVVPILDEWVDDSGWFVVMPLLPGGPFPDAADWTRVRELLRRALFTLAALHARGVVHADLKPENLIVDGETITLIDLGFARDRHAATDLSGFTLDYAAPELWFGEAATGASDVFALARVAARALGATPTAHADMHRSHAALQQAVASLSVPTTERDALARMLAWDASERPTAAEAAAAFGQDTTRELPIRARHRFDHTAEDMRALLSSGSVRVQWLLDSGIGQVEDDAVYFTREEVSRLELAMAPRTDEPDAPPLRAVDAGDVDAVLAWGEASVARPERLRWSLPLARWCVGHTETTRTERHIDALALFTSLAVHSEQAAAMHDAALTVDRAAVCPVGEQCAEVLRAAIAVRTQGRLDADSVTRVVKSTPRHPWLEPAMTLVKVWQMRSDMPALRAWLEEQLEREEDPKKVGRLLTWLSIVAYKQQDYEVGLAAIQRKRASAATHTLADDLCEMNLTIELGRLHHALRIASAVEERARRKRNPPAEARAVRVRRSAIYRLGVEQRCDAGFASDAERVSDLVGALAAFTEAAIAFRAQEIEATRLAMAAERLAARHRLQTFVLFARALLAAIVGDTELAKAIHRDLPSEARGGVAVQILGLCRLAGCEVTQADIRRRVKRNETAWDARCEVLSIRECLEGKLIGIPHSGDGFRALRELESPDSRSRR